jgi:hypothetical protein
VELAKDLPDLGPSAETRQIVTASLHDILEDPGCPAALIARLFGSEVSRGYLSTNGAAYADHLEVRFNARAEAPPRALLSQSPAPQLMHVQEALSQSPEFPSTHALQQVFKHIRDGLKGGDSEEWWAWLGALPSNVFSLVPLSRLIPKFTGKTPLDRGQQGYLSSLLLGHLAKELFRAKPLAPSFEERCQLGWSALR